MDGDGFVSQKDFFLAKHFDKDNDGKLNQTELKSAKEAIQSGFENNFMFGLERAGLNDEIRNSSNVLKHIRIIQKNGKILTGEDFTSIAPLRPSSTIELERPRTRQEL